MKNDNSIYLLLYYNGKKLVSVYFYYYKDLLIYVEKNHIKDWRYFIEKIIYY